jgi:hypothetical protein
LVDACAEDYVCSVPACQTTTASFALVVAETYHFVNQLKLLVMSGRFSPDEALEYLIQTLAEAQDNEQRSSDSGLLTHRNTAEG